MSEASTQKLIVVMTCAFGAVLVLAGYNRQSDDGFERIPLEANSVTQAQPKPLPRRAQPTTTERVIPAGNRYSEHWQSAPTNASSNANFASARNFPAQASAYDHQSSIGNYFAPTTPPEQQAPSRKMTRHPAAQPIPQLTQQDYQVKQSSHRRAQQPTNQFHDFGNVGQAVATSPIQKRISNVAQSDFESLLPERDLFTLRQGPAREETSAPAVSVLKTQPANLIDETPTKGQPTLAGPLPPQVFNENKTVVTTEISTPSKLPAAEAALPRIDKRVRKANWTEIEPVASVDPRTHFRPLEQQLLQPQRANPQVESLAREKIQYGQSLTRRRAYFAAREEFIRALLLIANSYNAEANSSAHPERLAQALIAVDELGDFMRSNNGQFLQQRVISHKSQLLSPEDIATTSPMQAVGLYSDFAQAQIVQAIGFSAAGSEALHALGKLESIVPETNSNQIKTLVFYRAAIRINPSNAVCANDLGVLLFNMGRLEEAEKAMIAALGLAQTELSWNNLALVHSQRAVNASSNEERNRQLSLAKLAAQQADKIAHNSGNSQPNNAQPSSSQWATPNDFHNNAAFPNVVVQHANSGSAQNKPTKPNVSRSATLKQKMKDWF